MTLEVHPEAIGTLLAIGALVFTAIRQCIIWRLDPGKTHLPWVLITAIGIVFSVTRAIHLMSTDADTAVAMIRIQFALAMFLPGLALATIEVLSGMPMSRLTFASLLGALPLQLLCVATPWLIGGPVETHHDLFGHAYYGARTGWMMALVVPICAGVIAAMRARLRRSPTKVARLHRNSRIGVFVFVACGLHDTLVGAGVVSSIFLLEYAFVAFGVIAANFEAHGDALALGELESRYRHLADATREGVALCGDRSILDANRALTDMLGAPGGSLRGRPLGALGALVVESDRRAFDELLGAAAGPLELTLHPPDQTPLVVSIKATPAPAGSPGTRVLLIRDVTGERELQARLTRADRLAAIGTLAAGTAHEINNPLTFVLANAELLKETVAGIRADLPPATAALATELVDEIVSGGGRIRRVVQDLMALARDRRGDEIAVDIAATLDRCIAMANSQLRHHARVVKTYLPVPAVYASEGRLFQVFLNLIVNAGQAIVEGHAEANEIRVATRTVDGRAVIEIADTGTGIDAATLPRIFEPYFTTKAVGHGTGLGLSISQGIITALGGTIEVASEVGVGTTVRISLPAAPASAAEPAPRAAAPNPPRLRVLIVDDEISVAKALARMLQAHDVELAHSGRTAFARLQQQRYDVVLCDLMMPDVTGMELHAQLVAAGDEVAGRFVFMTGGVATQAARDFLDGIGPERWVKKPIPMAELRKLVAAPRVPA